MNITVSEASQIYSVSVRTLKFFEEKGMLTSRRLGQSRCFELDQQKRISLIISGRKMGFSLDEINRLLKEHASTHGHDPESFCALLSPELMYEQILKLERQKQETEDLLQNLRLLLTVA